MKQPHAYICKYGITKVTLFKRATWQSVAMYTGRSSQPRPRQRSQSLLSQKHDGVKLNFIVIHKSGYGGVHPHDKLLDQSTNSVYNSRTD